MRKVVLNLLTPKRLISIEERSEFLDLLCNVYPDLAPERYGYYEPLRQIFDLSHPEFALESWHREFLWKRHLPHMNGSVWSVTGPQPLHSFLAISIDSKKIILENMIEFTQASTVRLNADFVAVHQLNRNDIVIGTASGTQFCHDKTKNAYDLVITTHDIKKYLPDLYWITVFGQAYVNHFGREKILSAPVPIVKELENGSIYLQLSDSPENFETNFEEVDAVRQTVKRHLGSNSFFDIHLPEDHVYDVPIFNLPIA